MKKYLHLLKISFEDFFEYRLDLIWQICGIGLSTLVLILFWLTLKEHGTAFESFTKQEIIAYYVYMGVLSTINFFPIWWFAHFITLGNIINVIVRPISYILYWFINLLPKKIVTMIVYLLIGLVLLSQGIKIFPEGNQIIPFITALSLGLLGSFILNYTIGLLAIWIKRVYGITHLIYTLEGLFAGVLIPISLLPDFLQNISTFFPTRYFIYFPVEILQENLNSETIIKSLIIEIFWIGVLSLVCNYIWKKGLKSLDVVGI